MSTRGMEEQAVRPDSPPRPRLNLDPLSTYEVLTRQMVDDLTREVSATRQRVDTLFYLVIGSIVLDVLARLAG
jgi:hypothetical protein